MHRPSRVDPPRYFGSAYESHFFSQKLNFSGVLTTLNIIVWTFALAIIILIIVLIFYEEELTREILTESGN